MESSCSCDKQCKFLLLSKTEEAHWCQDKIQSLGEITVIYKVLPEDLYSVGGPFTNIEKAFRVNVQCSDLVELSNFATIFTK